MYEDQNKNLYLLDEENESGEEQGHDENYSDVEIYEDEKSEDDNKDETDENSINDNDGFSFELENDEDSSEENLEDKNDEEVVLDREEMGEIEEGAEESEEKHAHEETVSSEVSVDQATIIKKILDGILDEIEKIKKILPGELEITGEISTTPDIDKLAEDGQTKIVEGVFDGEAMVGSDGKQYDVPANYASKSKLVEGDILKLTINPDGSFLFKQIGPSERSRVVGILAYNPTEGRYLVTSNDKKWNILTASVTYFKGKPGDEAVILVPKNTPSRWAAVENIISKKEAVSA